MCTHTDSRPHWLVGEKGAGRVESQSGCEENETRRCLVECEPQSVLITLSKDNYLQLGTIIPLSVQCIIVELIRTTTERNGLIGEVHKHLSQ